MLGYALIGEDGELLRLDDLRAANARADVGMHQYAYAGWNMFLPLHVPERAPQMRSDSLLGEERLYLEGMRLPNTGVLSAALDYWRMYEDGICCFAESYRDDYAGRSERLGISLTLMKLHSILAHARLVGQEMPAIAKVILHMEWKGLAQRYMMWDRDMIASSQRIADDRFARTITLDWAENPRRLLPGSQENQPALLQFGAGQRVDRFWRVVHARPDSANVRRLSPTVSPVLLSPARDTIPVGRTKVVLLVSIA